MHELSGIANEAEGIIARRIDEAEWAKGVSSLENLVPDTRLPAPPNPLPSKVHEPQFVGRDARFVSIESLDRPKALRSPVVVGRPVLVKSAQTLLDGHLCLPVADAEKQGIAVESVRVFRWLESADRLEVVAESGSKRATWAWARINVPGVYVAIGLPRDPVASRLLKTASTFSDLAGADSGGFASMLGKVGAVVYKALDAGTLSRQPTVAMNSPNPGLPDANTQDASLDRDAVDGALSGLLGAALGQLVITQEDVDPVPTWTFVGPRNIAGCCFSVGIDPFDEQTLYVCSADGGAWRLDGADDHPSTTWVPLTDRFATLRTQVLATAPSARGTLYLQMRDQRLYRSSTRGERWTLTSPAPLGLGWRLLVHPRDAARVYLASTLGFWRSDDWGQTWVSGGPLLSGEATDLALDPARPGMLYLAVRGRGVLVSRDDGSTWSAVAGLPATAFASGSDIRIALGLSGPPEARRIAVKAGRQVYLSQSGITGGFTTLGPQIGLEGSVPNHPADRVSGLREDTGQGGWCHCIAIDPFDEDLVYAGQDMLYRIRASSAGGGWEIAMDYPVPYAEGHPDQHAIVFDLARPGVVYLANDGGVYRSLDHGYTWCGLNESLHVAQIWRYAGFSGGIFMGAIDHFGLAAAPTSRVTQDWIAAEGASWENQSVVPDPVALPATFYVFDGANPRASNLVRRRARRVPPGTGLTVTADAISVAPGLNVAGLALDPRSASRAMLIGGRPIGGGASLFRTLDRFGLEEGGEWRPPVWTGENITLDSGDFVLSVALTEARSDGSVAGYALTANAVVYCLEDATAAGVWDRRGRWTTVGAFPLRVIGNPFDRERLYVVVRTGGVARSRNGGRTWETIVVGAGLPTPIASDAEYFALAVHPAQWRTLFAATSYGLFVSYDEGDSWRRFGSGLPNVQISDVFVERGTLFVATLGRGLWRHRLA